MVSELESSSHHKVLLLSGGLCLPFENVTNTLIKRFIAAAVGKINKFRRERLRELEEKKTDKKKLTWLTKTNPCITVSIIM